MSQPGPREAASPTKVELEPVDASNWRDIAGLEVEKAQLAFVAPTTHYLAMCAFGGIWSPLAIRAGGRVVGMLMWAIDPGEEDACWFGGVVIDRAWQRLGIGRRAVAMAIERLSERSGPGGFALSYDPANDVARRTYAALGFEETGEMAEDEVVARFRP